jgi:putative addiction module killer protein
LKDFSHNPTVKYSIGKQNSFAREMRCLRQLSRLLTVVPYVLPLSMIEVREYLEKGGHSSFAAWSDRLNREVAARVAAALARIQQGNLSNSKGVGAGVFEYRIDFGPGYRIYFGKDGDRLVILGWRRNEKTPTGRYQYCAGPMARL